ncbi:MAG: hypothetical protein HXY43_01095 [Fischerella sp.]|jgi:hypothetical protein|uniref:DUF6875 domain-containing protein n=1 Tax=Fischerella sp. TaxID=1191 RepID=UPI001802DCB6|nr:hypothetical protein [Fischerella sp.]NWF57936.1 hypothetical protein [Fischerella sp.]
MRLYTLIEIEQFQQDLPYLIEIMQWVKSFLAKHHPDLGRTGPVCPFVPQSLKSNNIHFKVIHTKDLEPQQIEEIVIQHRQLFLETEPREKQAALYKTFLLIFPDITLDDTCKFIDSVQKKLKPSFVELGLMLGEFHKRTESPGLHNSKFRPLRSPIPMLAIRFMVESDLPFLINMEEPHLRIQFLESYLKYFEHEIKDESQLKKVHQELILAREHLISSPANSCSLKTLTPAPLPSWERGVRADTITNQTDLI